MLLGTLQKVDLYNVINAKETIILLHSFSYQRALYISCCSHKKERTLVALKDANGTCSRVEFIVFLKDVLQ